MSHLPADIPLKELQKWMQQAITDPQGVTPSFETSAVDLQANIKATNLDQILTRSQALTAAERLAIYSSAYFARLLDCLRESFPVVLHCVGNEAFDALAFGYLCRHPSQSYTLNELGTRFPEFLRATCPKSEEQTNSSGWSDFVVDLAELELTFSKVFDGPGTEGQTIMTREVLAKIQPDQFATARLFPVPCLRLMRMSFPAQVYYSAYNASKEPEIPRRAETYLAITRQNFRVRYYELCSTGYLLLSHLIAGATIGAAIEATAQGLDDFESEQLEQNLTIWFRDWTYFDFFLRLA